MADAVTKIGAAILLAMVIAGTFALAWHGTITGGEALTTIGGIVAIAGAAFAVHTGISAGTQAAMLGASSASGTFNSDRSPVEKTTKTK